MRKVFVEIQEGPVSPASVLAPLGDEQRDDSHGAQATFFGVVRDVNHGKRVVGVSYDVFDELAVTELTRIGEEARARWGEGLVIRVIHSKGRLTVGEASVGVAVASMHRAEAFDACRYVMEELKKRAPIWKQEHYVDGDSAWLKGHALCAH